MPELKNDVRDVQWLKMERDMSTDAVTYAEHECAFLMHELRAVLKQSGQDAKMLGQFAENSRESGLVQPAAHPCRCSK